jgi:galactokinase
MHNSLVSPVQKLFVEMFNQSPLMVFAPGRINLIGEHTDYNEGFVMPAAIDLGIVFAISLSIEARSKIYSNTFHEMFELDLSDIHPIKNPAWANYLLGVIKSFKDRGYQTKSFNCVFGGNIPIGAGLSSSAALECGFAIALNELFKLNIAKIDLIKIAQWAEHNFAGVKCGIMDQFASVMGLNQNVLLLDCRSLEYQYFPIHLNDYRILICDSMVKHTLADSEYNVRRLECEQGVSILKRINPAIESLRDVTEDMINKIVDIIPQNIYQRCLYVIQENNRVLGASKDLVEGNLKALGCKMYQTHEGLSTQYEVSCAELDFLVNQAKNNSTIIGSRMMGGGFGGCTINIIHQGEIEPFIKAIKPAYFNRFRKDLKFYRVKPGDGVHVI